MNNENNKKRYAFLCAITVMLTMVLIIVSIYHTGVIKGINPSADEKREELLAEQYMKANTEGTFYDRNGAKLTRSNGPEVNSTLLYPEAYSYIIGTRNSNNKCEGLRETLKTELYDIGKGRDGIGADVTLTIDTGLQKLASSLLVGHTGSINVINADTGEILCLASRGAPDMTLNANEYSKNFNKYKKITDFFNSRSILSNHAPGSTVKILASIAILENDIEQKYVVEQPYTTPLGNDINNFSNGYAGYEVGLQTALNESINTYFATRAILAGLEIMNEIAERFGIGETIKLDFTTLTSNYDVTGDDPTFELGSTWYGQGKTVISPLHMTMIMGGIMNENNDMPKPYLISEINNEGKVVYEGKSEILKKNVLGSSTKRKLTELLNNTAVQKYGFPKKEKDNYGTVIAKTGTCEINNKTQNHVYLLIGYSFGESNYAICIDWTDVSRDTYGSVLVPTAKKIIGYINSTSL